MKRTLTLILFAFAALQVSAQSGLGNLGFENWSSTNSLSNKSQPNGFIAFGQGQNTSDPHNGSIALRLTTEHINYSFGSYTLNDTIGIAVIGNLDVTNEALDVGTPYPDSLPGCPDSIVGYMQHTLPNQDSASILSQVKDTTGDTIATAKAHFGGNRSDWTKFKVEFDPIDCNGSVADSIGLLFTSESVGYDQYVDGLEDRGTQTEGGVFQVDAVSLYDGAKSVSLKELVADRRASKNFSIMPNPAREQVRFQYGSLEERVRIFDMTGRNVRNIDLGNGTSEQVNVSAMDEGLYIYRVEGSKGEKLHSGKLQVIH